MPQASELRVGVKFLVVPDGVNPDTGRLRLSLSVMPDAATASGPTADLLHWPSSVAAIVQQLRVVTGQVTGDYAPHPVIAVDQRRVIDSRVAGSAVLDPNQADPTAADKLWKTIFGPDDATLAANLQAIADTLKPAGGGQSLQAQLESTRMCGYETAELARIVDQLSGAAAGATLSAHLSRDLLGGLASVPATFDGASPSQGWWLHQYATWLGQPGLTGSDTLRSLPPAALPAPDIRLARAVIDEQCQHGRAFCSGSPLALASTAPAISAAAQELVRRGFDLAYDADLPDGRWGKGELRRRQATCRPLAAELHRFTLTLQPGAAAPIGDAVDAAATVEAPEDSPAAHRKLAAILGYPLLAKYLGLVVDVEIGFTDLQGRPARNLGAVAVQHAPSASTALPRGEEVVWTAYKLVSDRNGRVLHFGPATRAESSGHAPPAGYWLKDGFANLQATRDGGPRFSLVCDDVTQYVDECVRRAELAAEASAAGDRSKVFTLPARQARGISLVDAGRRELEAERAVRQDQIRRLREKNAALPTDQQQEHVRDLEDLVEGLRIDVAMTPKDNPAAKPDRNRWRTLVARDVSFTDLPAKFVEKAKGLRKREDGSVRPMTRTTVQGGLYCVEPHDVLFTWHGESLALSGLPEPIPGCAADATDWGRYTPLDPAEDLPLDVTVAPPAPGGPTDRRPPPLRVRRAYYFGARLMLTNGCGLGFDEAVARYDPALCLGDREGGGYTYRRCQEIRAPEVLLDWNDRRLVRSPEPPPGETVSSLVVRDKVETTQRFVTPAAVPFELAEQHGVFDGVPDNRPKGAFDGLNFKAVLNPDTGEFPLARDGTWGFADQPQSCPGAPLPGADPNAEQKTRSRGSVLVLDVGADSTTAPLYPDPLARRLRARLLDIDEDATGFDGLDAPLEFWSAGALPATAAPVNLELAAVPASTLGGKRGRISRGRPRSVSPDDRGTPGARPFDVPTLRVDLAPGQEAQLELWCDEDAQKLRAEHEIAKAAAEHARRMPLHPALRDAAAAGAIVLDRNGAMERVGGATPVALVQNRRRVTVVHAVKQPLEPLAFRQESGTGRLGMRAVSVNRHAANDPHNPPQNGQKTWAEYVAEQKKSSPLEWPSEAGGSTTFFVGSIDAHRPTSGKVRCEAIWGEHTPSAYVRNSAGGWVYRPKPNTARLFSIDLDRPHYAKWQAMKPDVRHQVDLLLSDVRGEPLPAPNYRALSHTFADGKARKLRLSLVSTSRFTNCYERKADLSPAELDRYERSTGRLEDSRTELWVDCTFRPPPPEIERILPIFRWRKTATPNRVVYVRETALRIYLKRDWFASGDGEQLGIVFATRPDASDPEGVCELDNLNRFGQYVTRCGSDPLHTSTSVEGILRPSDILNGGAPVLRKLKLAEPEIAEVNSGGPDEIEVMVVPFTPTAPNSDPDVPQAEQRDEGHYVDVVLRTDDRRGLNGSYFPFVQLGLVRFQPHGVSELQLSHPVARFVQVPPPRTVEVRFPKLDRFQVTVTGPGYDDTTQSQAGRKARPQMVLQVLQSTDPDQVPEQAGQLHWSTVVVSDDDLDRPLTPSFSKGSLKWEATVDLPTSRKSHPYCLVVEEYEFLPDFRGEVVRRGPMMSRTIDLQPWNSSDKDEAV